MSNPVCSKATLVAASACYNGTRLSDHEQLALKVFFDLKQLAAIGGTDYSSAIPTLAAAANTLTCGFKPADFEAAKLVIASNNATAAGATLPSTQAALAEAVRCLEKYTPYQLRQMELLLYCALGRGKAYPQ